MRPFIGVSFDFQESGEYSKFPWYALRKNYMDVLSEAGGLPVALPYHGQSIRFYLDKMEGLVISGGPCDVPPDFYGQSTQHSSVVLKQNRTSFELALIHEALPLKIPILGICGGEQVLNVALGGTLLQHIPESIPDALAHEQLNPANEAGHVVQVVQGTKLADITGTSEIPVNSSHHQAVDTVAAGVLINAKATDGVIEGIELVDHPFCLGIQWHPEFLVSEADNKLFVRFIEACVSYGQKKEAHV